MIIHRFQAITSDRIINDMRMVGKEGSFRNSLYPYIEDQALGVFFLFFLSSANDRSH